MQDFIKNIKCEYSEKITSLLNKRISFALSGLTNCAKLVILAQLIIKNKRKIIFITESEQTALKFQNDIKNLFNIEAAVFPYQDGSIYDSNSKNLYKYSKQVQILKNINQQNIVIVPQKALFEKFADEHFFNKFNLEVNIDDEIDTDKFAQDLIKLGYKRKTLAADIGEFSIRGDIIDVFPLNDNPFRIELWGDTVTDIRIFDNSTQKSISKVKKAIIQPVYKFVLDDKSYKQIENMIDSENENHLEILENLKIILKE